MKNLKHILKMVCVCAFAFFMSVISIAQDIEDDKEKQEVQVVARQWYSFTMKLHVPRIYNNSQSLGYRKYQMQTIRGQMSFDFDQEGNITGVSFTNLCNKTHRLANGKHVTYCGFLDDTKTFTAVTIGNNKTKKFSTASICFSLMAEPSYNIGEFDEDTSLFVTLAGKGTLKNGKIKSANGYASGTLGCGCYAYGHISPTRIIWWYGVSDVVSDVAAVYGTWRISAVR